MLHRAPSPVRPIRGAVVGSIELLNRLLLPMRGQEVRPGLYQLSLGVANAFLLEGEEAVVLVDTGAEDDSGALLDGIRGMGYAVTDVDHILVTHCHQDHAGGLATAKAATGAEAWMHPADADLVEQGQARRSWTPTPGVLNRILYWTYIRGVPDRISPVEIDHRVADGDTVPGGLLIAGDAVMNIPWLRHSIVHEDLAQGRESLRRLSERTFETAVFGHGRPILTGASQAFRRTFGK